ncbi:3-hydroxyisobutyrate dehydrogenase [Desulfocicer vacuolatum DSM 3385]|uniref:3-hydroxyisobutyrate dehydrogenase n=1 Tax=Desulfocicer vacuolatum DSM 3385 TaxID=1121400 RepID=A0A1W1ZE45_9BACT|nr:NAD(P)-dependent oxidoreductase [Desulfocicer vacuolatum]SMC46729.1 3-hydroxyisobutyrate dehydrogenase [Desulfocicer vacuolatum DSM 3385]
MITNNNSVVGFIGIGVMGNHMARHILKAGYTLYIHSRTRSKTRPLCREGAVWQESVAQLAKQCPVIITMVGYPTDVESIYMGPEGILENAQSGTVTMDMTTSRPDLAADLYEKGQKKGIHCLDAPVTGGDIGAENATLSIMVGGKRDHFKKVLPILKLMGKNIHHQGPASSGQHTKMANQIAIAAGMVAMCEALSYAKKTGLSPEKVIENIGQGAAGSWSLNNLAPRIIKHDFSPGFYVKHFIKDMGIALESARALGLKTPGLELAADLYAQLAAQGCENEGTQALYKLFQK